MSRKAKVETITKVVSNQECQNKRQALSQMKRIRWGIDFKNNNQKKLHQRKMRKLELRSVGRNITVQTNNTICSELKNDKGRI